MISFAIDQVALNIWEVGWDEDVGTEGGEEGIKFG